MPIDGALRSEVENAIAIFANSCAKGTTQCSTKVMTRIFKDCKLFTANLTTTDTDIAFSKFCSKGQKLLTTDQFIQVVEHLASKAGTSAEEMCKVIAASGPRLHGATQVSDSAGTQRLTDTSRYTGSHRERFDESGKGKGKEGREYIRNEDGYVGAYKGKGTYNDKFADEQ